MTLCWRWTPIGDTLLERPGVIYVSEKCLATALTGKSLTPLIDSGGFEGWTPPSIFISLSLAARAKVAG